VLANRAQVLMRLRKWSDAVRDLKEAGVGAASPNGQRDVALAWDLGRALFLGDQIEESVQAHRQLLAQLEKANAGADPASPLQRAEKETLLLLAQLAYHQGDVTQAKKYVMQWYDTHAPAHHTPHTEQELPHQGELVVCSVKKDGSYLGGWQMMSGLGLLIEDYTVAQTALQQIQKLSKTPSAHLYAMQAVLSLMQVHCARGPPH